MRTILNCASLLVAFLVQPHLLLASDGDFSAAKEPISVIDGIMVDECAWPQIVYLTNTSDFGVCSGVYIGGRTILTAAHCTEGPPPECGNGEGVSDDTGDSGANSACMAPDEESYLSCNGSQCEHDEELISGQNHVYFGEQYSADSISNVDVDLRKEIPVRYCRRLSDPTGTNLFNEPITAPNVDIAYCVLAQEPEMQAIPVMMHCEVEQFLTAQQEIVAVGFGIEGSNGGSGTKRLATGFLPSAVLPQDEIVATGNDFEPGRVSHGDSGGPLLFQLPDGTWRVIGIASNSLGEYNAPWHHMEWILDDPNVAQEDILPCHDESGQWSPTESCGQFPIAPGQPSGAWGRAPGSCWTSEISGWSATCGPGFTEDDTGTTGRTLAVGGTTTASVGTNQLRQDQTASDARRSAIGCAFSSTPNAEERLFYYAMLVFMITIPRSRNQPTAHNCRMREDR